jgi:hypothetical protein
MYGPKMFEFFYLFDLLRMERVQNPGHNMAAGARHFRHSVMSAIFAGGSVTSRYSRQHLPRVIRDSVISVILAGDTEVMNIQTLQNSSLTHVTSRK